MKTGGAPAMSCQKSGVVGLLRTSRMKTQYIDLGSLTVLHFILYHNNLFAETMDFQHSANILVKAVNSFSSKDLNFRELQ